MKKNKDKLYKIVSIVILVFVMACSFLYIKNHLYQRLNSDDASELILGKLLANSNTLISKDWYYSTELRVLNTNIFYALAFKFTDNFFTARMIAYVLMWIIYLGVYLGLCKALNIRKNNIISACLLFIPFSNSYYSFTLSTAYYIPHIVISFLTIMFLEFYLNKKKNIHLILSGVLGLFAGLGGPRQIMVTYLPLFVAALVDYFDKRDFSFLKYSLIVLLTSGIGYAINTKLLSNYFDFLVYGISYTNLNTDRLGSLLNGIILNFGYKPGFVLSTVTITNGIAAICILLTIYVIYYSLKNKDKVSPALYRLSLFVLFNYIVFILLYIFTNMAYADRYFLPLTILFVPLIVLFFEEVELDIFKIKSAYLCMAFVFMMMAVGVAYMYSYLNFDLNVEKREILKVLQDNDYHNGYATFWNGNIYTELSNGDIDMRVWCDGGIANVDDINTTIKWLELKSHDNEKPNGKVFVLLSSDEYEATPLKKYLSGDNLIYKSDNYVVYGYDSFDDLMNYD